jgi:CheY-specific phosphatase CheX
MVKAIEQYLVDVTRGVFTTMLNQMIEPLPVSAEEGKPGSLELHGINGSVGFGGKMTGNLFFSTSPEIAEKMAHIIIGGLCEVGPKEICDVVGEITNMLAGGCKSRLCDAGIPVVMTIPNIIRGQALKVSAKDLTFLVRRSFKVPALGGEVDVILLGKIE